MALVLWLLYSLPLLPLTLVSLLLYFAALLGLGTFDRQEMALLGRLSHLYHLTPSRHSKTKIERAGQP